MRYALLFAVLTLAPAAYAPSACAADKPAEPKKPWLVEATVNPVHPADGKYFVATLKITNNTDAPQTLTVPRFWECHCDNHRLGFGGWDHELMSGNLPGHASGASNAPPAAPPSGRPTVPPTGPHIAICPANSRTEVKLGPGESYTRSWNWIVIGEDGRTATNAAAKSDDFTFRLGLIVNGELGQEPVWSPPIKCEFAKPAETAAAKK